MLRDRELTAAELRDHAAALKFMADWYASPRATIARLTRLNPDALPNQAEASRLRLMAGDLLNKADELQTGNAYLMTLPVGPEPAERPSRH